MASGSIQSAPGYWIAHVPVFTGFSADPTVAYSRYARIGNVVIYQFKRNANGTSNATTYTQTLPFAAAQSIGPVLIGGGLDNGATLNPGVFGETTAASAVLTLSTSSAGGAWTNSGNKASYFTIIYEV